MPNLPQKVKACRALALPDKFEPTSRVAHVLSNIGMEEIIGCLRSATEESAQLICAMYDRLNAPLKKVVDIDLLIAAAHVKDPHSVAAIVSRQYTVIANIQAQMVAAKESAPVMAKVAEFAKERDGYSHAKLLLQTAGSAPVPKNQVNYNIGNKIDNRVQTQINVDSHEAVVDDVAGILSKLPRRVPALNVPSRGSAGENPGHRGSEEDQASGALD